MYSYVWSLKLAILKLLKWYNPSLFDVSSLVLLSVTTFFRSWMRLPSSQSTLQRLLRPTVNRTPTCSQPRYSLSWNWSLDVKYIICKNCYMYIYTWIWYNLNTFLTCRKNIYATPVYYNGHIIYSFKDDIHILYIRYFIWWDTHDTKFPHLQEMDGTNIKKLRIFFSYCSGSFERKTSIHDTETREAHKPKPKKKAVRVSGEKTSKDIPWATEVMLASRF